MVIVICVHYWIRRHSALATCFLKVVHNDVLEVAGTCGDNTNGEETGRERTGRIWSNSLQLAWTVIIS